MYTCQLNGGPATGNWAEVEDASLALRDRSGLTMILI
jgi:hypothetical protein